MAKARTASSWNDMLNRQMNFNKKEVVTEAEKQPEELRSDNNENFKAYKANFENKYGVTYASLLYWIKKIERKEITEKELPEKYKSAYRGYLITIHRRR